MQGKTLKTKKNNKRKEKVISQYRDENVNISGKI